MNTHATFHHSGITRWKSILGIRVASVAWREATAVLDRLIAERRFTKVGFLNAHIANLAVEDAKFAALLADFLVLPDGVGVDMAAKILYGEPFPANLNGTDFIPGYLAATKTPLTVGLIGAKPSNVEGALRSFTSQAPQHRFVLINDGFFKPADEPRILERIRTLRPDILLVAMGVPRQEIWISENMTEAHCTLPIAVGALFDFMSGAVPRAPLMMRKMKLEWVFRLVIEPSRLWRRYVVGNPVFLLRVLRARFATQGPDL